MSAIFSPRSCRVLAAAGAVGVLLAGCATSGDAPPANLRAATALAHRGEEAYVRGRAAEAVPLLKEAVRLQLTAGDLAGAARGDVNLALAQRAAGDTAGSTATAARLRDLTPAAQQQARETDRAGATAVELAAGSAWLDALLALDRGDAAAADAALGPAGAKLPSASPWPGRTATLRAEIALVQDRPADALQHALAGRRACAAVHDRAEEARAHRIAGAAHLRLGQTREAQASYLAAVKLEAVLGGGSRMAGDLDHLAAIARTLGDEGAAQLYAARARAIAAAP